MAVRKKQGFVCKIKNGRKIMKQKVVIGIIVGILIAIGGIIIGLVISPKDKSLDENIENNVTSEANKYQNTQVQQNNKNSNNTNTSNSTMDDKPNEKHVKYNHVAVEGCVIIESNSQTGEVVYKRKCESC